MMPLKNACTEGPNQKYRLSGKTSELSPVVSQLYSLISTLRLGGKNENSPHMETNLSGFFP